VSPGTSDSDADGDGVGDGEAEGKLEASGGAGVDVCGEGVTPHAASIVDTSNRRIEGPLITPV
jgi:hypothetical protein